MDICTFCYFVSDTNLPVICLDRICAAVYKSFSETFAIEEEALECQGSIRGLNVKDNLDDMSKSLAMNLSMPIHLTRKITKEVPLSKTKVSYVELGNIDSPDVYISYLYPKSAMLLLRKWQTKTGNRLVNTLTTFAAVCSTTVDACNKNSIEFSLGCLESRKVRGIKENQLAAIIPSSVIGILKE